MSTDGSVQALLLWTILRFVQAAIYIHSEMQPFCESRSADCYFLELVTYLKEEVRILGLQAAPS